MASIIYPGLKQFMSTIIKFIYLLSISIIIISCSTVQKTSNYNFYNTTTLNSSILPKHNYHFKKYPSIYYYFYLQNPAEEIKITVSSKFTTNDYKNGVNANPFFIVEKITIMDKNKYNKKQYTVLGKNYSSEWLTSNSIIIRNNPISPADMLSKGLYRIVITAFNNSEFTSEVKIECNQQFEDVSEKDIDDFYLKIQNNAIDK